MARRFGAAGTSFDIGEFHTARVAAEAPPDVIDAKSNHQKVNRNYWSAFDEMREYDNVGPHSQPIGSLIARQLSRMYAFSLHVTRHRTVPVVGKSRLV